MATPNDPQRDTPQFEEGYNDLDSSGDSSLFNNDDDDIRKTRGHNVENITPGDNDEPGSTRSGETTDMGKSAEPDSSDPYQQQQAEEEENEKDAAKSYIDSIHSAILSLQKEIYKSEDERKQSESLIEKQFGQIIQEIMNKKFELITKMNSFYDEQKQQSLDRILELKQELNEKELEIQIEREKELQRQQQLKKEEEEKAAQAAEYENDDIPQLPMSNYQRLSIFGSKIKENASKAKNIASAYIDSWRNENKNDDIAQQAQYSKHDKIRLFIPRKELTKLIETDIKLSTEWWNPFKLNHIVYNTYDAELWRTNAIKDGWYNAFGTIKVRKSQIKRWNIKICQRKEGKQKKVVTIKKQPADIVLGIIESDKIRSQEKPYGFWQRGYDGFGLYGWNGKIFHKKNRGKIYSTPFYIGSTIGIELDMMPTPGMDIDNKSKPKTNLKSINSKPFELGKHGAVVKFYIDDEDLGIAFYDLDLNKEYSLAVSLNSNAYTLQLID